MVLTLYLDWMSQPCRAVALLLQEAKIPHEIKEVRIGKLEQKSAEFLKINPMGKLPVIDDNGFILGESCAILRYLCSKYPVPDHFYPRKDLEQQARVNFWLDWYHGNLRLGSMRLMGANLLGPFMGWSAQRCDALRKESLTILGQCLPVLEAALTKNPFVAGGAKPSIVDLVLASEVMMLPLADYEEARKFPQITAWLHRMDSNIASWRTVNKFVDGVIERRRARNQNKTQSQLVTNNTAGNTGSASEWSPAAKKIQSLFIFDEIKQNLSSPEFQEGIKKLGCIFKYSLTASDPEKTKVNFIVNMKDGQGAVYEESKDKPVKADTTFLVSDRDYLQLASGKLSAQKAFIMGKLKLQGNMQKAMQFSTLLDQKQGSKVKDMITKQAAMKSKL